MLGLHQLGAVIVVGRLSSQFFNVAFNLFHVS